jgi:hypothetical protein
MGLPALSGSLSPPDLPVPLTCLCESPSLTPRQMPKVNPLVHPLFDESCRLPLCSTRSIQCMV